MREIEASLETRAAMIKRRYVAASILGMILLSQVSMASSCMSGSAAKNISAQDLGWVKSDMIIYAIDRDGLYAAKLNSQAVERLATFNTPYVGNLSISPDGKMLYFRLPNSDRDRADKVGIYDIDASKLIEIPQFFHEYFRYDFIGFSPDSRHLAWLQQSTYRSSDSLPSIYVYSIKGNQTINFDYPPPHAQPGKSDTCFKPQWSQDSKSIYSNFMESGCSLPEVDEHKITYFKLDVATGATQEIAGGYKVITKLGSTEKYQIHYLDENKQIPYRARCDYASRHCDLIYGEPYIENQSRAYFQEDGLIWKDMNLYVQVAAAKPVKVQSGTYSQCSGSSINIEGWVEGGKYLIYTQDWTPYIYGVDENRSAPLTHLPHPFGKYSWKPEHSAGFAFARGRSQSDGSKRVMHSIFFSGD